jgi:hypothetical protein
VKAASKTPIMASNLLTFLAFFLSNTSLNIIMCDNTTFLKKLRDRELTNLEVVKSGWSYCGGNTEEGRQRFESLFPGQKAPAGTTSCYCGHDIELNFYITNNTESYNENQIIILGSTCIKRFKKRLCIRCGQQHRNFKDKLCNSRSYSGDRWKNNHKIKLYIEFRSQHGGPPPMEWKPSDWKSPVRPHPSSGARGHTPRRFHPKDRLVIRPSNRIVASTPAHCKPIWLRH